MKPVRSRLRRLAPILIVLVGVVFGRGRALISAPLKSEAAGPETTTAASNQRPDRSAREAGTVPADLKLDLGMVGDVQHREQIERVVLAMDRTGSPPPGVAQGGRRGGQKGMFRNAEGRLPRKAPGYWTESDVWPGNGPRDAERLILGAGGEVYWTADHYLTFARLR